MKTINDGAEAERNAWMSKIRRLLKKTQAVAIQMTYEELLTWGKARAQRTGKRKGGLGRK